MEKYGSIQWHNAGELENKASTNAKGMSLNLLNTVFGFSLSFLADKKLLSATENPALRQPWLRLEDVLHRCELPTNCHGSEKVPRW